MPEIGLAPIERDEIPAMLALSRRVFGAEAMTAWHEQHLEAHLDRFPEGQLAVRLDGQLVASSASFVTTRERALADHTWMGITQGAGIPAHDPDGDVLYGLEIMVDPDHQGLGLSRLIYRARKVLARAMELSAIAVGGRLAGYDVARREDPSLTPQRYLDEVEQGERWDPVLGVQQAAGFQPQRVLENYVTDAKARHHAALMVWETDLDD